MNSKPNILVFVLDDVGMADLSYISVEKEIHTPNIDRLAHHGIILKNYYTYSLCTPSRASMLTGRYAINTGLTSVLLPGTPAALSSDIPTIPEILKNNSYSTRMVGKWHLGHSSFESLPSRRGFEDFVGMYMWDCDYYSKQMYDRPDKPAYAIDWVHEYKNGTMYHFAEPKHSTLAVTDESLKVIESHDKSKPLFFFISFTAAHSPLQPLPYHEEKCKHLPHRWRRQFCGLVMGIDESMDIIVRKALEVLGSNTYVVAITDNGGSPWYGGSNFPLRSGKMSPFEGGVKVPGFVLHLSWLEQNRVGTIYDGLFHVSDWLPTILSLAKVPISNLPSNLNGIDQSSIFTSKIYSNDRKLRNEILLELYCADENMFNQDLFAYRVGDYKYIQGIVGDGNWYYPSSVDKINATSIHHKWTFYHGVVRLFEDLIRLGDYIYGEGAFDSTRMMLVHGVLLQIDRRFRKKTPEISYSYNNKSAIHSIFLFNIREDPYEQNNIVELYPELVKDIQSKLYQFRDNRPKQQYYWEQLIGEEMVNTFVSGDCSMNPQIPQEQCRFVHPWILNRQIRFINNSLSRKISMKRYDSLRNFSYIAGFVIVIAIFSPALLSIFLIFKNRYKHMKRKEN